MAYGPLSETVPGPWPSDAPTADTALTCASVALVKRTGPSVARQEVLDDRSAVLGGLARPVHGLRHALAQVPVVVDPGEAEVGIGQPAQLAYRVVGRATALGNGFDERAE